MRIGPTGTSALGCNRPVPHGKVRQDKVRGFLGLIGQLQNENTNFQHSLIVTFRAGATKHFQLRDVRKKSSFEVIRGDYRR